MLRHHILQAILFISLICACRCNQYELPDSYSKELRPNDGGPPLEVRVGVFVESIGEIDENTMDFHTTMYFRESWIDPRLAFNGSYERTYEADLGDIFWTPDFFFLYEKDAQQHDVTLPNRVMKIQPDGSVFRSSRISVTSACYMDLHRFPFDSQMCSLNILSYSYNTKDLILVIADEDVETQDNIIITGFYLQAIHTFNEEQEYSIVGNFSRAKVTFTFQRQFQAYLLSVYIPSLLLVIIAWFSLCIGADAAAGRLGLVITTVLTMTTIAAGVQSSGPVVTYAKALDIWIATCLVFIVLALLEFVLANYLVVREEKREAALEAQPRKTSSTVNDEQTARDEENQCIDDGTQWTAARVDRITRFTYPVVFLIFNIIYWPIFL